MRHTEYVDVAICRGTIKCCVYVKNVMRRIRYIIFRASIANSDHFNDGLIIQWNFCYEFAYCVIKLPYSDYHQFLFKWYIFQPYILRMVFNYTLMKIVQNGKPIILQNIIGFTLLNILCCVIDVCLVVDHSDTHLLKCVLNK